MICRRHIFTAQLFRLSVLRLLGIELIRLDLHSVFQQRHLSGVAAALAPSFTEGRQKCVTLRIVPRLHIRRSGQIRIEPSGRSPDFGSEAVGLNLLVKRLPQRCDRRLIAARIAG